MRINVTRSSMPSFEEYMETVRPLWDSRWLTNMGANHEELARRLCDYLKVPNVSLFVNGHMALEMALQAMDLEGEVITVLIPSLPDQGGNSEGEERLAVQHRHSIVSDGQFGLCVLVAMV